MNAEQILNATLAGGVILGASCDMIVDPFVALILGSFAGIVSTLGYRFLPHIVYKYLRLHDTCGVIYLHLIPGILGGLASGLIAGVTVESRYGDDLSTVYIKMGPDLP